MFDEDYGVLDIETVGEPWDGRLLCVGWRGGAYSPAPRMVRNELADPRITKVVFTKYDHRWLRLAGYDVEGPIHDVQVMAWLDDEAQDLSLEAVALKYAGIEMDKRIEEIGSRLMFRCDDGTRVPLEDAPPLQLAAYNERDLQATDEAYRKLRVRLFEMNLWDYFLNEMVPFTETLARMEATGVPADIAGSKDLRDELAEEIIRLEVKLRDDADLPLSFNLGSAPQLREFLYKRRFELKGRVPVDDVPAGFTVTKTGRLWSYGTWSLTGKGFKPHAFTDTGKASTASPKLKQYYGDDPWVADLLDLKQRETLVNTFLTKMPERGFGGRIYGRFNQTGTVTGRLSSSGPNLQNIPSRTTLGRRVRALFRPEDGAVFVHGDYSQLEPRLSAHFSQDPIMLELFRNGEDIYLTTARGVFGRSIEYDDPERSIAKTFVLAMSYLAGARTLAEMLSENGFPTRESEARDYLKELRRLYQVFFAWSDEVVQQAETAGFVTTVSGRKRRLVRPGEADHWKDFSPTQAVNAIIQGSAADVVQRVMVASGESFPQLRLLVQVHDELMWEADGSVAPFTLMRLQKLAERGHGFRLTVPLKFEPKLVGNWAEGK